MSINKNTTLGGIVLSGGAGRRMKREKGLCLLDGKPMISYVLEILQNTCDEIIISANNDAYGEFGYPLVSDEKKGIGPLGGIYSCLKKSKAKRNIIISCDMPFVSKELIQHILDSSSGYQVVIPVFKGLPEPLCAFYDSSVIPKLEIMIEQGIYKLQEVSRFANTLLLDIPTDIGFYNPHMFTNVNSPEELALAEKQLIDRNGK